MDAIFAHGDKVIFAEWFDDSPLPAGTKIGWRLSSKVCPRFLRRRRLLTHADQKAQHFERAIQITGSNQHTDIREISMDVG